MAFWIFKWNPELYRLDERLADENPTITWLVRRYRKKVSPGDTVFILKNKPGRSIRAVLWVNEGPLKMKELKSEQQYWVKPDRQKQWRVLCRIILRLDLPAENLESVPGLEKLSACRHPCRGTNFPVTKRQGQTLLSLIPSDLAVKSRNATVTRAK